MLPRRATKVVAGIAIALFSIAAFAQQVPLNLYQDMQWRMIGPFRGGRALTASGVPGQPDTWYFGAVGGGVWKTIDGGNTWSPIFDGQPIASIGAICVAPSDANTIYVGTGEADMRSDISFGNGIYKSIDAGLTWKYLGLKDTQQIGRILVDPHNPNIVLAAALGHGYGPNNERGVFRSDDGGETWRKVLFTNDHTGAIDLAADPGDFRIVYAALWNAHRTPWSQYQPDGGPGSGIYKSTDGGSTWTQITGNGLPGGDWGRVGIAVARGKGINRVYALIDAKKGGLFRSDDGGTNWELVGTDPRITERAWYFSGVTVDPENPDVVYLPNVAVYRSTDGGRTFESFKGAPGGDDYHALWIDPWNSKRMILASDQGTVISVDGGVTWSSWYNQPTAQIYHVATDNQFPYYVYGAQQDSGSVATASRSDYGSITFRDWFSVGAGESGYIAPDPSDANIVYGGDTYGGLFRFDRRSHQSQDISPVIGDDFALPISQRKLRFTWTSPLVFSPFDSHTLYFGSQYLMKTSDRGMIWHPISPDLSGASTQASSADSGPLTASNARERGYGVVYTIAPSPVERGQIWTGSDTGLIYLTKDAGKTWNDVTPHGLGDWSKISMIDASRFEAGTAYTAVDCHRIDDYQPYIFRTHDFGKTWVSITDGIPRSAYVHVVREDGIKKGLLYAGTETGIYVSFDDGDHWKSLQLNLPVTPVHDLVIKNNDLVVATHGRSFWILDDLTPLRQISRQISDSAAFLFRPENAIRLRNANRDTPLPAEEPAGQNPPAGAILDYYVGTEPSGDITLDVLDSHGTVIRHFSSADRYHPPQTPPPFQDSWFRPTELLSKTSGMHRFVWNMRYADPPAIEPQYSAAVAFGENTPLAAVGPLVLPGAYRVRLVVAGHTFSVPLMVALDPRVHTSPADLVREFELENQISLAMGETFRAFHDVQAIRTQLKNVDARIPQSGELRDAADSLEKKLLMLAEGKEASGEKPRKETPALKSLNGKLAAELASVDSADTAPTEQAQKAVEATRQQVQSALHGWQELLTNEITSFNRLANKNGIPELAITHSTRD